MGKAVSPLAPERFPGLQPVAGVRFATRACEIRYKARSDVCLIELAPGTTVAGVFTQSLTAAAPVLWCRKALGRRRARAIVVNSGNANAFTGAIGIKAVADTVQASARLMKCPKNEVFIASTGVIGEPLPDERLIGALQALKGDLAPGAWQAAAEAIMTTDTFPKGATRQADIGGTPVTLNGIAKGSGMIAPDMATMLAFIFTDAKLPGATLQALLEPANEVSFNCVTVDG
ncbi:MAG: bifunctional ornithine acetyltransferase/N-acetylglutamate synthase, partial [Kiloniellales bacterium]